MTFSIITVCYNCASHLETTFRSILAQGYSDFEYLVIDGKSSDNTVAVIEAFAPQFRARGISFTWISESDVGIYDAMNKGAALATGDWVLYMNAADVFFDSDVLQHVFPHTTTCDCDVLYGDVCYREKSGERLILADSPISDLRKRMIFCHQSVFVRRGLLLAFPFDLRYCICADFAFFRGLYLRGYSMVYMTGLCISYYEAVVGLSSRNKLQLSREVYRIRTGRGDFLWYLKYILVEIRDYVLK